jgi:crotonobetainyl-CoA:carnitine CoA-transferase CaiB-like acyl-CoA transferase
MAGPYQGMLLVDIAAPVILGERLAEVAMRRLSPDLGE